MRGAADVAVVATRPHPSTVLRRDRHLEDAADDLAVFEHVEVVLIPADGRAFEDQPGHRRYPSSSSPASVILNVLTSKICPLPTTLSTANPIRTNSANWSAVQPWARMTAWVRPSAPRPASSVSARRWWGFGARLWLR